MTETTSVISSVIGEFGNVFELGETVLEQITGNPIFLFLLAASLVPIGIGIFKRLKGAAR